MAGRDARAGNVGAQTARFGGAGRVHEWNFTLPAPRQFRIMRMPRLNS